MQYIALCVLLAFTASALAQSGGCSSTPGLAEATPMRGCEVLRRGDLGGGLLWEVQSRTYQAPRAGSGDMTLRLTVLRERGEAVAWTEPGYGHPQRPEQLASPRGMLLRLPVTAIAGTQTPLDEVWLRREPLGDWVHLDARLWRAEAEARLGPGEAVAPAFRLQIRPLRATGQIIRRDDPAGRATGGSYTAWLDLGEDRLLLIAFSRR